jgi:hypothetical protein
MYTTMTRAYRQSRTAAAGEAPAARAAAAAPAEGEVDRARPEEAPRSVAASRPEHVRGDEPGRFPGDDAPRTPRLTPIASRESFKGRAYTALKDAIVGMDVYRSRSDIKLDERRLASDLGVSLRRCAEAMAQLESARASCARSAPRHHRHAQVEKREVIG